MAHAPSGLRPDHVCLVLLVRQADRFTHHRHCPARPPPPLSGRSQLRMHRTLRSVADRPPDATSGAVPQQTAEIKPTPTATTLPVPAAPHSPSYYPIVHHTQAPRPACSLSTNLCAQTIAPMYRVPGMPQGSAPCPVLTIFRANRHPGAT